MKENEFMTNGEDFYRKRIAELEQQISDLQRQLLEAEEINKAKSLFLSNMSHDIRTPMNAIVGMTSIGLSHIDEKTRVHDCLNKIQTASAHLMSLVNDVLDMSRIDSGRMTISEDAFSLPELIHDVSVIIQPQAALKNQAFRIKIEQIHEENLIGDPLHLRQILVNIIGNAVKYTPADGQIDVVFSQCFKQTPSDTADMIWLLFECKDNGLGMSEDFLKRIFEPFERVRNELTNHIEGTGLGMSIVKKLVESMSGQITVESEEGRGSCFRVELPLSVSQQNSKPLNLPKGETVMIAESLPERTEQISKYLRESGLIPLPFESGLAAVTHLTELKYEDHMPCALLLGQELNDTSPLEFAAHVRQLAGRDLPIILISDADWAQIEYRATRVGINAFVPCPLFRSRFLDTLSDLIGGGETVDDAFTNDKDFSKYHVILAEDIPLNQEIALELLSMIGVQVEVADDGARAVELFRSSPAGYFNLIFMDIHMPIMDGYEATRQIRGLDRPDAKSVWIVAMTADAFVEDIRRAKDAGMNEHVSKPIDPQRLQDILYIQLN